MPDAAVLENPRFHGILGFMLAPLGIGLVVSLRTPESGAVSFALALLCTTLLSLKASRLGVMPHSVYAESVMRSALAGAASSLLVIATLLASGLSVAALLPLVGGIGLAAAAFR